MFEAFYVLLLPSGVGFLGKEVPVPWGTSVGGGGCPDPFFVVGGGVGGGGGHGGGVGVAVGGVAMV